MTKPQHAHIHIDHYLQAAILSRLLAANGPLRFSALKEDGIENSLFMYHANKLVTRGAITKDKHGFALTSDGARWINAAGRGMWYIESTPRPLVQFVVRSGDSILLSVRTGQLKELLNDYMLPAGLHRLGLSADESADRVLKIMFEEANLAVQFLATVENISRYSDGFIYHSFAHVYALELSEQLTPSHDDRFASEWMAVSEVTSDNPLFAKSKFLPLFLRKIQTETLQPREVITIQYE